MNNSNPKALHAIAGNWQTTGYVIDNPNIPVTGTDIYDIFPGGYFLIHHVGVTVGDQPVKAIEIIGEPNQEGGFIVRSFDSDGNTEIMQLTIDDDGVFHFTGGPEVAKASQPTDTKTAKVRSTLVVAKDGQSMTALWERSEDGTKWHPWMKISFKKKN